jgi:hypothetical protein
MPLPDSGPTAAEIRLRHWSIPHVFADVLAIVIYFLIYSVSGDSDLFLALATGAAGGALSWLGLELEYWVRRRAGT